ncbi:glomulin, FKBP associated protein a [Eucyclogobius newberryi]|uniref:glomulin, FKBP associated protein a n=1 Tax=Eucyclogobius newberryi TaxID=166745 RepID=UPI003B5C8F52
MALEQLSEVVLRCQTVPENAYTTEDYDVFTVAGRTCIEEGNSLQLLSIVLDEKNQEMVRCMGWNLLPPLIQVLLKKEDKHLAHCLAIFNHLIEVCQPKELLIGLLEQLEHDDPDTIAKSLLLLLNPLQKLLLCLGVRKASSLGMALSTVLEQLCKLPVPATKEQEEDDVFSLCRCCSELSSFIRPFVEEARQNRSRGESGAGGQMMGDMERALPESEDELRTELLKFCMQVLSRVLLAVQLRDQDTLPESPLRDFACSILLSLRSIGESLPALVHRPLLRHRQIPGFLEEEVRYPKESLACASHLLFVHHLLADMFPTVYSPVYCVRANMEHICLLLSRPEESRIQKGLELYEKTLVRVEDCGLSVDLLELRSFLSVPQNLVKVMTICPHQHLRGKGLKAFQLSINKFNTEAKYKFFQLMLKTSNHSGVEGYVIKNIKNQIDSALKVGGSNPWFGGLHLLPLLRSVLKLPDGPETDLLQHMDRIMEALNLLRYLVIRDKVTENQTGIWAELYKIEDTFLKPLRVGINMSRAHYERELLITKEDKKSKAKEPSVSVSVGDEKLPSMTTDTHIQALHSALHTFDMIESVLVRIEELIEVKESS